MEIQTHYWSSACDAELKKLKERLTEIQTTPTDQKSVNPVVVGNATAVAKYVALPTAVLFAGISAITLIRKGLPRQLAEFYAHGMLLTVTLRSLSAYSEYRHKFTKAPSWTGTLGSRKWDWAMLGLGLALTGIHIKKDILPLKGAAGLRAFIPTVRASLFFLALPLGLRYEWKQIETHKEHMRKLELKDFKTWDPILKLIEEKNWSEAGKEISKTNIYFNSLSSHCSLHTPDGALANIIAITHLNLWLKCILVDDRSSPMYGRPPHEIIGLMKDNIITWTAGTETGHARTPFDPQALALTKKLAGLRQTSFVKRKPNLRATLQKALKSELVTT